MKKIVIFFLIIISILTAFLYFASSKYFFNKYIAKNIKEYGFSYTHVDGEIFKGFTLESLSYKGEELSSNVEFNFNPLKLTSGVISIDKLHLIGVHKDVLEKIANDFKQDSNESSSNSLDLDFSFKDIILTIKPFKLDNIKIKRANLAIDSIEYSNFKFNIGNLDYETTTSLGDFRFYGKYNNRVLDIYSINLENFNLKDTLEIINSLKKDTNSSSNSDILNSPFTPKKLIIKKAIVKTLPFKIKGFISKGLDINGSDISFDMKKLLFNKAKLNLNYNSKSLVLSLDSKIKDRNITIDNLDINIVDANRVITSLEALSDSNSSTDRSSSKNSPLIDIDSIRVLKSNIRLKNYSYKDENIKKANLNISDITLDINNKSLVVEKLKLDANSTNSSIRLEAKVNKDIIVRNLKVVSANIDKILELFKSDSNSKDASFNFNIPKKLIIKEANVSGKKITFNPLFLKSANINVKDLNIDLVTYMSLKGKLNVEATSNWGNAKLNGKIKNNNFYTKGSYAPDQYLLDYYNVPLIANNLDKLNINGRIGLTSLDLNTTLSGKNILKRVKDLNINSSQNQIKYNYLTGDLFWDINADIYSSYTKEAKLINKLKYLNKSDTFKYSGVLKPKKDIVDDITLKKLFNNLTLKYSGGYNGINIKFDSKELNGSFISDYNKGKISIFNNKSLYISRLINLGNNYSNGKIDKLKIVSDISFDKLFPIKGKIDLTTNMINLSGDWIYNNKFESDLNIDIPKNSLLIKGVKSLQYKSIKNFRLLLGSNSNSLNMKLNNSSINGKVDYIYSNKQIKSQLSIKSLKLIADGTIDNISLKVDTNSIKKSLKSINNIYKLPKSKQIDGALKIEASISNLNRVSFLATSPKVIFEDKDKSTQIDNILVQGLYSGTKINISNYRFIVDSYKIYSSRANSINFNKDILTVNNFWVNDSLALSGKYNLNKSSGDISIKSKNFKIENRDGNAEISIDCLVKVDGKRKSISGRVDILKGLIKSTITKKNVADNSDIVILQRKRAKESTDFAKYIKLNLKIYSKRGVVYRQKDAYFSLRPNMTINKQYNGLSRILGKIDIKRDSYYILNGKKLKLSTGVIKFSGKSSAPNINIEMVYKGRDYKVNINISGTPTRPILFFSSNPPLTKEQILAYLLFDDSSAVGTHSQESMLNMIGGGLAKSLLGSIGIKIDHIAVKENGFTIGKSIGKNVIIYYNQNRDSSSIKTRVDITQDIKTEFELGKDKQSADIIFSKEY